MRFTLSAIVLSLFLVAPDHSGSTTSKAADQTSKAADQTSKAADQTSKAADKPTQEKPKSITREKPLKLDDAPLLLLDDDPDHATDPNMADNSRCHVCHLNFSKEPIALVHAKAKIGCQDCHGPCDAHIDDESWAIGGTGTPPSTMYPPERIDEACRACHDTHDAPAKEILRQWQEKCPEKQDFSKIVCTDCHGEHRLVAKFRKAWWDKKTGQPLKMPKQGQEQRPVSDSAR